MVPPASAVVGAEPRFVNPHQQAPFYGYVNPQGMMGMQPFAAAFNNPYMNPAAAGMGVAPFNQAGLLHPWSSPRGKDAGVAVAAASMPQALPHPHAAMAAPVGMIPPAALGAHPHATAGRSPPLPPSHPTAKLASAMNMNMSMNPHAAAAGMVVMGPTALVEQAQAQRPLSEKETKELKRKKANRESARRSKLRKKEEFESLAKQVDTLSKQGMDLRTEIARCSGVLDTLQEQNKSLRLQVERLGESNPEVKAALLAEEDGRQQGEAVKKEAEKAAEKEDEGEAAIVAEAAAGGEGAKEPTPEPQQLKLKLEGAALDRHAQMEGKGREARESNSASTVTRLESRVDSGCEESDDKTL